MSSADQKNWIERLTEKIPGYSGYVDRERRRDIDKRHREQLADRLRAAKAPLTDLMRELTGSGRLMEIGPVDQALKKLDKLENRVRYASYGYAGFFDAVKIEQPQLDAIYQFDLAFVEHAEKVESKLGELKAKAGSAQGLKDAVAEAVTEIDAADKAFDERHNAINSFDPNRPPGKPLFQA
ncbi:MAG TPA: hypothetical protein VKM94_09980 [Blastocatellia bacterium]|nr:hypothetical protein [Blastocatellia bacterium]